MSDQQGQRPELVNLDERYHLLGVQTVERDDNTGVDHGDQAADQHIEGQVVYTTNDLEEAKALCRNGGWIQAGVWIAVSGYRDTQKAAGTAQQGAPRALRHDVDQTP